jgi:hypothetical protein
VADVDGDGGGRALLEGRRDPGLDFMHFHFGKNVFFDKFSFYIWTETKINLIMSKVHLT